MKSIKLTIDELREKYDAKYLTFHQAILKFREKEILILGIKNVVEVVLFENSNEMKIANRKGEIKSYLYVDISFRDDILGKKKIGKIVEQDVIFEKSIEDEKE